MDPYKRKVLRVLITCLVLKLHELAWVDLNLEGVWSLVATVLNLAAVVWNLSLEVGNSVWKSAA